MEVNEIWKKTLEILKENMSSQVAYSTYLEPAVPISFDGSVFTIAVELKLIKNMLENQHKDLIENVLSRVTATPVKLEIVRTNNVSKLKEDYEELRRGMPADKTDIGQAFNSLNINKQFSFENFIVGDSNKFAYTVALAVANNPGVEYNPFFLYGPSGLGKTHLMLAIGNRLLDTRPGLKVTYLSCEHFLNDMLSGMQTKKMDEFRAKYRSTDCLLIDDIQFIEGKEALQIEFFHTFNDLLNSNSQIVITSDRPPQELRSLADRMISRFLSGITTDIGVPDYETRIAILKKKAESESVNISDDVFAYIAERVKTNIRELEGALKKIIAYAKMSDNDINIEFADESLKRILPEDKIVKITHSEIKEKVCTYYNINLNELMGKSRTQDIALARQVAMYLCKKLTDMSNTRIGAEFGKDRTSVTHNVNKINDEIEAGSEEIKLAIDSITRELHRIG